MRSEPLRCPTTLSDPTFFSIWSYSTGHDLTGGQTNYLTHADAATAGLAYVQDAKAILAVDSTNDLPLGGYRDSYVAAE
jgi:hypothetical protein